MTKTDWDWYHEYELWVESQNFTLSTKHTYLVHVRRFLHWKEGSLAGGAPQPRRGKG